MIREAFYCSEGELALRHTAIAWLGSVLRDQFPQFKPLGGEVTPSGILYRMVGFGPQGSSLTATMLPALNERLKVKWLDAMRADQGASTSREMLRSNAVAFFEHRKEPLLAKWLQEENAEHDSQLLALVQIGSHVEPVALPHAASIELLSHLQLLDLESIEMEIGGKLKQVWVFHARIASSSQEIKQWVKQKKAQQEKRVEKHPLWVHVENMRVWTPQGMKLRLQLLKEWQEQCMKLGAQEILTQAKPGDESLPWAEGIRKACAEWSMRAHASGLQRAAECRTVFIDSEEEPCLSDLFYATSPESCAYIPRDDLAKELAAYLPFFFSHIQGNVKPIRLVLLTPQHIDATTRMCLETVQTLLATHFAEFKVAHEVCAPAGNGLISLCALLIDEEGGAWSGPSITLHTQDKYARPSVLLIWKAFGLLERWISWQER